MATPSQNSPSSHASTQGSERNNKRKHEDYPPTYEQYLRLKYGFLNSHALICDICRSLIFGSKEEVHLDYYAYDTNSNSLTETQVGDMILGHLDEFYRKVIKVLSSNYGYSEADATTAVLATGIIYGSEDPIGNALKHALAFLDCGLRVENPERQNFSEELKTLVKFVSMIEYDWQKKKNPYLCMDDFLVWLLIHKMEPSNASTSANCSFGCLGSHKVSSSSTGLQWKKEFAPNSSIVQFMPVAGVTEDHKLDASSHHSENAFKPELNPTTSIPGLASGRFTATTSLSLPNSNPNAVKKNPMSPSDSLVDKFSSLTLSESSTPEEKLVNANSKHTDSSWRGFDHRRPERRHEARLVGKAKKHVTLTNQLLESAKSPMLDSNCSLPKPDKNVGLDSSQSFATKNSSFNFGSFASSSFSMKIVNNASSLSHAANVDAFTLRPSESSSDVSFKLDYSAASISYVLENFLSRSKDLQLQLQYWTNWAHDKVLQATNRLNKDKAELQTLRQEKLEAKKEKEAFAHSIIKKIREMGKALSGARTQVDEASVAICKLDFEKTRLEEELKAAKIHASKSAAKFQEALLQEIMTLKKVQTCERKRTMFQKELVSNKRVLSQLQKQLQQAQVSHGQVEVIASYFIVCYFFSKKYFWVYYYLYIYLFNNTCNSLIKFGVLLFICLLV